MILSGKHCLYVQCIYTGDEKCINISLWGKRKLAGKFWRKVADQYLNTKLI